MIEINYKLLLSDMNAQHRYNICVYTYKYRDKYNI